LKPGDIIRFDKPPTAEDFVRLNQRAKDTIKFKRPPYFSTLPKWTVVATDPGVEYAVPTEQVRHDRS
jgi:hypothetical protein